MNGSHLASNPATIYDAYDFDRDGLVNAESADEIIASSNRTNPNTALKLITVPAAPVAPAPNDGGSGQPQTQPQPQFIIGDATMDGRVDTADLMVLTANLGATGAKKAQGDFDDNGIVDAADFIAFKANFGKSATMAPSSPAATPASAGTTAPAGTAQAATQLAPAADEPDPQAVEPSEQTPAAPVATTTDPNDEPADTRTAIEPLAPADAGSDDAGSADATNLDLLAQAAAMTESSTGITVRDLPVSLPAAASAKAGGMAVLALYSTGETPVGLMGETPMPLLSQPLADAWIYANLPADADYDRAAESPLVDPLLPKLQALSWKHDLQPAKSKKA
jgi:hypothetical protein